MPVVIPVLEKVYDQSVNLQLGDATYTFRFKYNQTEDAWYLYLGLIGDTPRVKFKIVNGFNLLKPWQAYEDVPKGSLLVVDNDLVYGRPGKETFHSDGRFYLSFSPEGEDLVPLLKAYLAQI